MINTWHWLIWEAALPLFGAPVLYLLFRFGKWVTTEKGTPFNWAWNQALDPMGCLYGGAFLALHAGVKGKDSAAYAQLTHSVWVSFGSAGFCICDVQPRRQRYLETATIHAHPHVVGDLADRIGWV
jgi:hypothetical protein